MTRLVLDVDEDWCVLRGGGSVTSVEGTRAEWLEIANGLEDAAEVRFRRVAANRRRAGWELYSPRNSVGPSDCIIVASLEEGRELAKHIREVLAPPVKPSVWLLVRVVDYEGDDPVSVHATEDSARAAARAAADAYYGTGDSGPGEALRWDDGGKGLGVPGGTYFSVRSFEVLP